MKLARIGVIAAAVLAVSSVTFAQAKPDFSGTWTVDTVMPAPTTPPAGTPPAGGGGGRMGGPMTVVHKGDTLTIERTMGENKMTTTYKLDGSQSINKQMGRGGAEVEIKSVAKWAENMIIIIDNRPGPDGTMQEIKQTWSLDGGVLTIERTTGQGTRKTVYKKTT